MDLTYQRGLCNDSVRASTSDLTLHRWLTRRPMDKPREPTKSCSEASNPDFLSLWKGHWVAGRKNYPQYYEVSGRLLTGRQDTHPSSWSIEQKLFSQVTSVTTH